MTLRSLSWAIGLTAVGAAAASPVPSERELHTAQCVAALEVNTDELAMQVKAGRDGLRPLLVERLNAGTAFIGAAYLKGDRDEARSQALLQAALDAQRALSASELAARQASCAQEGTTLLARSNFIERAIVSRLAEKRLNKLLGG
jgi:hypothetical protein